MNLYFFSIEDFNEQGPLKIMITTFLLTGPSHTGFFIQNKKKFLSSFTISFSSSKFAEGFVSHNSLESWNISKQIKTNPNFLLIADLDMTIRQAIVVLSLSSTVLQWGFKGLWHAMSLTENLPGLEGGETPTRDRENDLLLERLLQCGGGERRGDSP